MSNLARRKTNRLKKEWMSFRKGKRNLYMNLQICSAVLLFLSIASFILGFIPASKVIMNLTKMISIILPPKSMSSVISIIGLSGTAFTWLITRSEDKVCGIRLADIINEECPMFFHSYFFLFVPSIIAGTYFSANELIWPTINDLICILLYLFLYGLICYRFVILDKNRIEHAYKYIMKQIKTKEAGEEYLLKAASYTRMLILQEHEFSSSKKFWEIAFSVIKMDSYKNWAEVKRKYYTEELGANVINNLNLAMSTWHELLDSAKLNADFLHITNSLLKEMTKPTEPVDLNIIQIFQVGLLLSLKQLATSEADFIEKVHIILKSFKEERYLCKSLACSTLMIEAIDWIVDPNRNKENLEHCIERLSEFVLQISESDKNALEQILLYAEVSSRWYVSLPLEKYLYRLSETDLNEAGNVVSLFDLQSCRYRLELLCCLICRLRVQRTLLG